MGTEKPFLEVLNKRKTGRVPFWFMRQAGRYLPEYRELRQKSGGFLNMVYNPKIAAEITMQPIRRFGMDAAIIFSDILVIPQALGQKLEFVEGEGPKLDALRSAADFAQLNFSKFDATLSPVYEALRQTKSQLQSGGYSSTALIGFCGAPWTLAAYMVEGGGSKDFANVKALASSDPGGFMQLIEYLIEANILYLNKQIEAGAEAVQIFDSHAGVLDGEDFERWVIRPTKKIIEHVRKAHPNTPIIGFPRKAGENYLRYVQETGVTAVGLDTHANRAWAAKNLQPLVPVQGTLDPEILLNGGTQLTKAVNEILNDFSGGPFIFNLGHGVDKTTPVEHVEQLVGLLREHRLAA
jgi:uroporphyrinogen decarboxylase